jgi:hypothetical protein
LCYAKDPTLPRYGTECLPLCSVNVGKVTQLDLGRSELLS